MEKIRLRIKKKAQSVKSQNNIIQDSDPTLLTMYHNGKDIYSFSSDIERIEEIIDWLYDNTTERFTFLGTETIYFESSADAMAFKLRWN